MAEINAAYAALTRAGETIEGRRRGANGSGSANGTAAPRGRRRGRSDAAARRPTSPPGRSPPASTLSGTIRPRNQTTTPPGARMPLTGQPPLRIDRSVPELRASQPSGPLERDWLADHLRPEPPSLDDALELELDFGKFHGHTLGEVAAFEPSYVDWLAGTVTRDPDADAGRARDLPGAGPAGDPAGASAAATGLALEPVPVGVPDRRAGIETPPAISPGAPMM